MTFIRWNIEKWKQAEKIVEQADSLSPDELADAYMELTADLAFAQTHFPASRITIYLNNLASALHNRIYRNKREKWSRIVTYWTREVPLAMRDARRELLVSFIIFAVSALIGVVSATGDPDFVRLVLGNSYVDMTLNNIANGEPMAVYNGSPELPMFLGITLARPILEAMSAPPDVIDLAEEYLSIFFCGMPFMMTYNFGSAIMRSVGDTSLPFYALLVSTVCNLLLDWLFAGVFGWGVSGVAWATVISTGVNAAIIVYFLAREPQPVTLSLKLRSWRLSRPDFNKMLRIGIPAGLQGMVFSISNIFIQSAINSFGSDAIAGSAAALTYEVYCYYIVSAFCAATIAFTGQNYGSGEYGRCKSVLRICMFYSVVLCGASNLLVAWQGHAFISLFSSSPEVMHYALVRFNTVLVFQCLAVLILPQIWKLDGIWLSTVVADILAVAVTVLFLVGKRKKYRY